MHAAHAVFLEALHAKRRLSISFFHRKEGKEMTRACAPLDFGPLRGAKSGADAYQLWDLDAKRKPFNVTVAPDDVRGMTLLDETFDPAEIITWTFKPRAWTVERDWGAFS
jgi:hypothetical protein